MAKSVYVSLVLARHLLWMKRKNNTSVHNDCGFINHHLQSPHQPQPSDDAPPPAGG